MRCVSCDFFKARYDIPPIGSVCGMECVETELFGQGHCRWCGSRMETPYTSIDSRLCSPDCSANYYAFVLGDRSAALGSGKRYAAYMTAKESKKKETENVRWRRNHPLKSSPSVGVA